MRYPVYIMYISFHRPCFSFGTLQTSLHGHAPTVRVKSRTWLPYGTQSQSKISLMATSSRKKNALIRITSTGLPHEEPVLSVEDRKTGNGTICITGASIFISKTDYLNAVRLITETSGYQWRSNLHFNALKMSPNQQTSSCKWTVSKVSGLSASCE